MAGRGKPKKSESKETEILTADNVVTKIDSLRNQLIGIRKEMLAAYSDVNELLNILSAAKDYGKAEPQIELSEEA